MTTPTTNQTVNPLEYEPQEARCYNHSKHGRTKNAPRTCEICQRMIVERLIVTKAVDAAIAAGYKVYESEDGSPTDSRESTLALLFNLDSAYLMLTKGDNPKAAADGWIFFVFGNSGWDVISDYTTNLDKLLEPVMAYAAQIERGEV